MKIFKYIIYYICVIFIVLGYCGFVKMYINSLPLYDFVILDYISALGIFCIIYTIADKIQRELLIFLKLKDENS